MRNCEKTLKEDCEIKKLILISKRFFFLNGFYMDREINNYKKEFKSLFVKRKQKKKQKEDEFIEELIMERKKMQKKFQKR